MSQTPNHICQICGNEYYACNSCEKTNSWKIVSCSPVCYQIYIIITEYRLNIVNQIESIQKLNKIGINIDNIDTYKNLTETIKKLIKEILSTEIKSDNIKPVKKARQPKTK